MKNFVVYNSSAGSGKTYTLVKEYLKIALLSDSPTTYRNVLAITFTNKAAAEMKERVIGALQGLSGELHLEGTSKFLLDDLMKDEKNGGLGLPRNTIQERSARVLRSIIHNYNDFSISTIDKFTHKIIRTFAHDLQLPLNFDVELDEMEVLSSSIDLLIAQVGVDEKLTKLLLEYTTRKADDEKNWHIEKDLFLFSKSLLKEGGEGYLQKIKGLTLEDFEKIKKNLSERNRKFEETLKKQASDVLEYIQRNGIEEKSFSASYFPKYWHGLISLKSLEPTASLIKIIDGERSWYAAKVDEYQKQLIDTHHHYFVKVFHESRSFIDQYGGQYHVNKMLFQNLYNLAVLNEIEKIIVGFKKDNRVLNISDFNRKISKIVENEPVPFIYERLGEKYNHYLIDEFQDTSVLQWHNLIPLVDNALSKGKFNMLVGDSKQAIYRFRGGEVEQILHLPQVYKSDDNPLLKEREGALVRNYMPKVLENNYRSKVEIVQFNNCFFQFLASKLSEGYNVLYRNLQQGYDSNNTGGGIQIDFLEAVDREDMDRATCNKIMELVNLNLNQGYTLRDIAILVRNNADGSKIANYLIEKGVSVISSESLLLNSSNEVNFLLNAFRFLLFPSDKIHGIRVLQYLIENNFKKDDLFSIISRYPENTLVNFLEEKKLGLDTSKVLNGSIYELAEYLINHFDLNRKVDVYVKFFLDKVQEYSSRRDNLLLGFLEWWELKGTKFSIVVSEGVDAVRVMSIHKSKGLEFPVVIYPFATSVVRTGEQFFWIEAMEEVGLQSAILPIKKELEFTHFSNVYTSEMEKSRLDLINMLYVALTRPKDRLFILSKQNVSKKTGKRQVSKNGSVTDYLWDFCERHIDQRISENSYRWGSFNNQVISKRQEQGNEVLMATSYNNWRDKIKISFQAPEVWNISQPEARGEYGTVIHTILSKVSYKEDLDSVLERCLQKGIFSSNDLPAIKSNLTALFNLNEVAYLFTDFEVLKNEVSILMPNGKTYQPDRVVMKEGKTIIVDFKTGKREDKHADQVINYRNVLEDMGYENVEMYLLYIQDKTLVRL